MRNRFISLCVAAFLATTSLWAYDFKYGELYYDIISDSTVAVTYETAYSDNYLGRTSVVIPESVIYGSRICSVTSIGYSAFSGCSSLTSVTIPNSVKSIGYSAFSGCGGLTSITIPNSVTSIGYSAFSGCSSLISITVENGNTVYDSRNNCNAIIETETNTLIAGCQKTTIPNSVTSIGYAAFSGCMGLTSVTIPNSVTDIGSSAFKECTGLTSITIPNSVTSIDRETFSGCTGLTSITIGNSVTSIEYKAFQYCSSLTSITIPNSVTSIDSDVFEGCTGLTSVVWNAKSCKYFSSSYAPFSASDSLITSFTIGDEVEYIPAYLCAGMTSLTSITIPNSVTSIGSGAFAGCSGLTSITIPNSVTSIGNYAFGGCSGLTSITVENYNMVYDSRNHCNAIIETATNALLIGCQNTTIPNSVTRIESSAFSYCSGLTSITIPNSVTTIGWKAFEFCTGLMSVTIPNSVTSIEEMAFWNVPNIAYSGTATGAPWGARCLNGYVDGYLVYSDTTKTTILVCSSAATGGITISNSVTSIGDHAFRGCSGLTSITIPNSVTSIGSSAFEDCSGLTSVTIPNSVTSIGSSAFEDCSGLTSVTIPNSVTSIGEYAFYYCYNLTSVTIPNSVTSIGEYAFSGCTGLTSITIPNSVTSIGWGAFSGCRGLTSITIPNSVTSIGWGAFSGCRGLTSITIPNSVTEIGDYAFEYYCSGLTSVTCYAIEPPKTYYSFDDGILYSIPLYVPVESIEKYKVAEEWKDFKEILPISAMPADADEPVIDPKSTTVTITWPATDKAATYTIEISKDGALVCTLTFDANGVLQNMRFATPARHAAQHTTQAEATGSGFRFVVEGLDYATTYTYTITAKDTEDKVVESYNGTFTTTAPTSTEDVHSTPSQPTVRKVFRNGQVYILRGDKTYTLTGEEVR